MQKVYDAYPDYFDIKFGTYSNNVIRKELDYVSHSLSKGARILDLRSGPGNHAHYFKDCGFDVYCLDFSEAILKKCREKGLKTVKMDFENMSFSPESFNMVWAYTSLLHIPKERVPRVISLIHNILTNGGHFGISIKEGNGEGFFNFQKGGNRWFSLYTDKEIRLILENAFFVEKH
ncbi:class I SAM-dependent methyltransferase [Candidatus Pacearchaeota archaeon]|nr:class I SAM-dependent methyltransferase [Candidatus Pacearchaeota archaeon]